MVGVFTQAMTDVSTENMGLDEVSLLKVRLTSADTPAVELKNIEFEISSGQLLALIGPNGAGKSTLIKVLAGDYVVPRGSELSNAVFFQGNELTADRTDEFYRSVSVMSQQSSLSFPFLVSEVIAMGRLPHSSGKQFDETLVVMIARSLGITELFNKAYTCLSGGEKQRVHFARAIAQLVESSQGERDQLSQYDFSGKFLILDEPFSAQDFKYQALIKEWIVRLKQRGLGVLLVVHDLSLVADMSEFVVALKLGEQQFYGDVDSVLTAENLSRLFDVAMREVSIPNEDGRLFGLR